MGFQCTSCGKVNLVELPHILDLANTWRCAHCGKLELKVSLHFLHDGIDEAPRAELIFSPARNQGHP